MQNVFQQINKAALRNANVHICGETGTGKLAAAAMIHQLSGRCAYPLITIDGSMHQISNMRPGRFEDEASLDAEAEKQVRGLLRQARRGTLILNDINQMGPDLQVKLLRVIKPATNPAGKDRPSRTFMPRIVTTSCRDPQTFLRNGTITPELFDHLSPVLINLKPLRKCKKDLPALANHYFSHYSNSPEKKVLPESIMLRLLNYDWPGNLYELQNTIQRYLAYEEIIFLPVKTESDKKKRFGNLDHHHPVKSDRKATCKL